MTARGRNRAVAAAASMLAAWLVSPSATSAPERLPVSELRRTPVVRAVEAVTESVVNISTEQRVDNPFHSSRLDGFFSPLFDRMTPDDESGDRFVGNSLGSGVVVDSRGYILTNEHVLWKASRVRVVLSDRRTFEASIVGIDPRSDLAVLKIDAEAPLEAAPLGVSSDLLIGETVIAIGNPYGLSSTVTTGVLSAMRRSIKAGDRVYSDFLQTDAPISSGSSGGALLNIEGQVIGINTAILAEGRGIGFAIPIDRARKVFEDLLRYGEVRVAWLGLDVRDLTERSYAALLGSDLEEDAGGAIAVPSPGVQIRRVYEGGPSESAGMAAGDLVTALGNQPISSRTDFETALGRFKAGDAVPLSFRRADAERTVTLLTTEFPRAMSEEYLADQIGIEVSPIPEALRRRYPFIPPDGVIVTRVRSRSRGFFSGLERGDILRGIDDRAVEDMASLRNAVPRMVGRDAVLLKVVRGRYQYHVTIELG